MIDITIVHNVVNPETGLTTKQENQKLTHRIPLDTLVEINLDYNDAHGCRLFVVEHNRDCDGTPLYSLSFEKSEYFTKYKDAPRHCKSLSERIDMENMIKMDRLKMDHGWDEGCLIVIKEPTNEQI